MQNILITQKIYFDKHHQINWSLENSWYNYFYNKKINLIPINNSIHSYKKLSFLKPKGIIISGGNDLYSVIKSKENLIREKYETKIIRYAIKKKIPILGVCRGFQLIAKLFRAKVFKINKHVRTTHSLQIEKKICGVNIRKLKINSFHNYAIRNLPKTFNLIIRYVDNSIEIAQSKKFKILCLMFHPERKNNSQKEIDQIIFSHFKIN
tara:strand:- start:880 stop:1503 length:624 start_codon:yes stop_codon:yes gene_type:complete